MIRIRTGSRLHFGLFSLPGAKPREFGGVGLMVEQPGVTITVEPADIWSGTGPNVERALAFGRTFLLSLPAPASKFKINVEQRAPEHTGLGVGTQLGLAVARAIAQCLGLNFSTAELARRIGRGKRSAIGIHGFEHGGFLVDGGVGATREIAPLVARQPFPAEWSVLLVIPRQTKGVHGERERDAFITLARSSLASENLAEARTAELTRLALLGMLPALMERNLEEFAEALFDFNRKVGEMFQPWQGGLYAHPQTTALVEGLRKRGICGVGQSSWGPTTFAIAEEERLNETKRDLVRTMPSLDAELILTKPRNCGATVEM